MQRFDWLGPPGPSTEVSHQLSWSSFTAIQSIVRSKQQKSPPRTRAYGCLASGEHVDPPALLLRGLLWPIVKVCWVRTGHSTLGFGAVTRWFVIMEFGRLQIKILVTELESDKCSHHNDIVEVQIQTRLCLVLVMHPGWPILGNIGSQGL